jgi:hypothetical protein
MHSCRKPQQPLDYHLCYDILPVVCTQSVPLRNISRRLSYTLSTRFRNSPVSQAAPNRNKLLFENMKHSVIARLKRDGTRAETSFGRSAKRTSPFKLAGVSVQSTTGSRRVRISSSNGSIAGYTMFRGTVQDYWLPTPLACFPFTSPTVRHRVPSGFNWAITRREFTAENYGRNKSYKNCSRKFLSRFSQAQISPKSTLHGQVNIFRTGYPRRSNRKHGLFFENRH